MSDEQLGLRPRPEPDPAVIAIVAAAVEQLARPTVLVGSTEPPANPWRFSGRWFATHHISRRDRPR